MTYQVLARKWRPRSFREMTGQGHVLKTLINALDNNRLHHAYLFTGTRGVGKTTLARILARCLNCEKGVGSEPCGECTACTEIDEGRFVDLIEVDAASRTKVEDTRELLDNVQYSPTRGRYKVYLIDEVHMLSGHSFNALLKTLEEPPPHVKFLLATTDPHKLPVTILSRCLQLNLKNLSPEQVMKHLQSILEQEQIAFEEAALWQLGRAARGSVRDALTLLDQAISYCAGGITDREISAFLGTIDQKILYELVDALAARDAATLLAVIDRAAENAPDFGSILGELLSYLHRVAIAQVVPQGIDNSQGDRARVLEHAKSMPAEDVQLYYQIALKGREELPLAVDDRSGLEMTLLRMLAFSPGAQVPGPQATLPEGRERQVAPAADEDAGGEKKKPAAPEDLATDGAGEQPSSAQPVSDASRDVPPSLEIDIDNLQIQLSELRPEHWIPLFHALDLEGITRSIAANCVLEGVEDGKVLLILDESQSSIFSEEQQERIRQALCRYFDREIELGVTIAPVMTETPAVFRERKKKERKQRAVDVFVNDDNVKTILQRFNGNIIMESIKPLTPEDY